ncbi:type II secretion system F family protein [Nanoarchaeota archaeon]
MEIQKQHKMGIAAGIILLVSSVFLMGTKFFFLMIGLGIIIMAAPFVFTLIHEAKVSREKEEMFLEFARNLVESVKTGTPISKSILNLRDKNYGALTIHIKKLVNQIALGIPLNNALQTFSKDVKNKTISRALTLIGQAERAGGEIGIILEAVAGAVNMSDKLKKERRAAISSLVAQGYIIFFIFIVIVLIMQFKILPMIAGIADVGQITSGIGGVSAGTGLSQEELSSAFLYLLLIQGFFSGLTIGKLSEGSIKPGLRHSFALMLSAFLISAGANIILG